VNDAGRRATRTFVQVGLVLGVMQLYNAFAATDLSADQVAGIIAVATPLVGFIQNLLEDNTPFPALLKGPASSGVNPIPAPEPPPIRA